MYSIVRATSLSWIYTMKIKGLSTCATPLCPSHKPNNTVRSDIGLLPWRCHRSLGSYSRGNILSLSFACNNYYFIILK